MSASTSRGTLAILAVALIQSAALGWMIWERISHLRDGRAIVLDVNPVDPRDLFRGDYVILSYPISTLEAENVGGDDKFEKYAPIYVVMAKGSGTTWEPRSIHNTKPENPAGDAVVLRGTVRSIYNKPETGTGETCDQPCPSITVKYGIESYFVPEGEGRRLEKLRNNRRLQIAARIVDSGEAAIAGLAIDGEIQYEDPLF